MVSDVKGHVTLYMCNEFFFFFFFFEEYVQRNFNNDHM